MTTPRTTWPAQIAVVLVLLAAGTASGADGSLSRNSPLGENAWEAGVHRAEAALSGGPHRSCGELKQQDAAELFVAPRGVAVEEASRRVSWGRPGARVRERADELTRNLNLANDGGIGSGGLNVTQHNLTPNDLMALSQRHSREYSLLEYTDGTRRLYAGPVNGWEVSSPIGQGIRRRMHTHPGFDNFTPSVADMESLIHHRAAGGGGQVEVIFRQSGTGRTLTLQMNERVALETLADLAQAGLYLPTDPVVAQRLLPILQGRLGGP